MEFYHFLPPTSKLLITYTAYLFFLFQKYTINTYKQKKYNFSTKVVKSGKIYTYEQLQSSHNCLLLICENSPEILDFTYFAFYYLGQLIYSHEKSNVQC